MSINERKWIQDCKESLPLRYRRYVDDIFAVFNFQGVNFFFDYFNSRHQNIKFTMETELL